MAFVKIKLNINIGGHKVGETVEALQRHSSFADGTHEFVFWSRGDALELLKKSDAEVVVPEEAKLQKAQFFTVRELLGQDLKSIEFKQDSV